jgi:hypothetical protein
MNGPAAGHDVGTNDNTAFLTALLQAGNYTLSNTVPAGATISHWECYNITSGTPGAPLNTTSISLALGTSWTCVAVFVLQPHPRLALLSRYVGGNCTGPTANLTAAGPSNCTEAPSTAVGSSTNITAPGNGLCNTNGTVLVRLHVALLSEMCCLVVELLTSRFVLDVRHYFGCGDVGLQ